MVFLLNTIDISLPLTNPVIKFLIILLFIPLTPSLIEKLKIPHPLGLIIA